MPRRGENVYKRKDGRWEGRNLTGHDHLGKAVYQYFYGRTYREVKEKMLAYTPTEATDGRQPAANHFGDVLDIWLRHKKLTVKESSYLFHTITLLHQISICLPLKVRALHPTPQAPDARRCPGSPYALDYCIINNQHFEVRTKGTMNFTEGKAGYFKIFIHGRSAENETGNLAVFADLPDFSVEIWRAVFPKKELTEV